jgi:hypothetical protein
VGGDREAEGEEVAGGGEDLLDVVEDEEGVFGPGLEPAGDALGQVVGAQRGGGDEEGVREGVADRLEGEGAGEVAEEGVIGAAAAGSVAQEEGLGEEGFADAWGSDDGEDAVRGGGVEPLPEGVKLGVAAKQGGGC